MLIQIDHYEDITNTGAGLTYDDLRLEVDQQEDPNKEVDPRQGIDLRPRNN